MRPPIHFAGLYIVLSACSGGAADSIDNGAALRDARHSEALADWITVDGRKVADLLPRGSDTTLILVADPAACTECSTLLSSTILRKIKHPRNNWLFLTRPPRTSESRILRRYGISPDGELAVAPLLGPKQLRAFVYLNGSIEERRGGPPPK